MDAQTVRRVKLTEAQLQHQLKQYLEARGWTVFVTNAGQRPVTLDGVKHYAAGSLSDRGIPDLICCRSTYGCFWVGFEIKTPSGKVSPEQQSLADQGFTFIVRSVEDIDRALAVIKHQRATLNGK